MQREHLQAGRDHPSRCKRCRAGSSSGPVRSEPLNGRYAETDREPVEDVGELVVGGVPDRPDAPSGLDLKPRDRIVRGCGVAAPEAKRMVLSGLVLDVTEDEWLPAVSVRGAIRCLDQTGSVVPVSGI
jgi:hypothetical protein